MNFKIKTKITLTYIFFAVIILFFVEFLITLEIEALIKKNIENELVKEIDLLNYYLTDVTELKREDLDANIKSHAKSSGIRITLIDSSGVVELDSEIPLNKVNELENHLSRPEIVSAKRYSIGKDTRLSKSTNQEYFYIAKAIIQKPKIKYIDGVQFIRTSISLANLQTTISEVRWKVLTAGFIVLFLVFFLSAFISKKITHPILLLIEDLKKISRGNYKQKLLSSSKDEIKDLIDSINKLISKLNEDIIEMERLVKVRTQFFSNASHELRTPLFLIQAFLETLLDKAIDDPKVAKDYLFKSLKNVDRLNRLLNDLIDISQIESGEMRFSFRFFPLNQLFQNINDNFKLKAEIQKMSLMVQMNDNINVYGDKEKLLQAVSNLVDNAIRYNPANTEIKIYSRKVNENKIEICVEDNGSGIPIEHLPRIFERFYRIDKERARETGGTGLGLSIVKHIIEAHSSKIDVTSYVGKGTIFSFQLSL